MEAQHISVAAGTVKDIDCLLDHRRRLWEEVSSRSREEIEATMPRYRSWLEGGFADGRVVAFLASIRGRVAGSGCIWVHEVEPRVSMSRYVEAYLLSMYTEPEMRRMGVASSIVEEAIAWCRRGGIERLSLHSSAQGKGLYEKYGFSETTEMRLRL